MRVLAGTFAVACLMVAACRMPGAVLTPAPSPAATAAALECPDGRPTLSGLTDFGAYIGTWQAQHQRIPQTSEYKIALVTGKVAVQCSPSDYVILESIDLSFQVPGGRAVLFALTELPSDSRRIFDHTHAGCRTLQYQSPQLANQLPRDDRAGLADITVASSSLAYNPAAVSLVTIKVGASVGDDSKACGQA
jgi:hypothetical protein